MAEVEHLNLLLCADSNYAMPLAVAARSAIVNCTHKGQIHLFIIESGMSELIQKKIETSLFDSRLEIHWIHFDLTLLNDLKSNGHLNASAYIRLLVDKLLPNNIDKVLYLDSDLIVSGDLSELWKTNLEDRAIAACQDQHAFVVSSKDALINYKELGIPSDQKYFNSGVMLINLKKWREEDIGEKTISYSRKHAEVIQFADQDCLNAVLWNDWIELDACWNIQGCVFVNSFNDARVAQLRAKIRQFPPVNMMIIHFTSDKKPWAGACRHPHKNLFYIYLDQTSWKGFRPPIIIPYIKLVKNGLIRRFKEKLNL